MACFERTGELVVVWNYARKFGITSITWFLVYRKWCFLWTNLFFQIFDERCKVPFLFTYFLKPKLQPSHTCPMYQIHQLIYLLFEFYPSRYIIFKLHYFATSGNLYQSLFSFFCVHHDLLFHQEWTHFFFFIHVCFFLI